LGHQEGRRILNAKSIGLTITPADIGEREFRVLDLIEATRQGQAKNGDRGNGGSRQPVGGRLAPWQSRLQGPDKPGPKP
jgi:hypothetical protein